MGNSITCSINCDCSIAATLCTVVYVVCCRYVIVNTVHRGGDGDDDDRGRGMTQTGFSQFSQYGDQASFPSLSITLAVHKVAL